jgi:hypothetical protein
MVMKQTMRWTWRSLKFRWCRTHRRIRVRGQGFALVIVQSRKLKCTFDRGRLNRSEIAKNFLEELWGDHYAGVRAASAPRFPRGGAHTRGAGASFSATCPPQKSLRSRGAQETGLTLSPHRDNLFASVGAAQNAAQSSINFRRFSKRSPRL